MAVRRESVRLELDDAFTSDMARAAAATALLSHELNNLSGKSVTTSRATQNISRDTDNLARSANRTDSSINKLSGRLELLVSAAGALAPALSPIGAVGIAAVAGLANQFGAVAVGAGTAVLAFQGVGTALKAVDKAAIQPTAANIDAARVALEKMPPAAQDLIIHLEKLKPVLDDLRATAAGGLLPGVTQSIDDLQARIPDIQRILQTVSQTTGHLFADAGASLASSKFDDFFTFLATEVPGTLTAVGKSAGNLVHALAEMWMAFTPLNNDFNSWLVNATAQIDKFATGLSQTQGFADFIDYVRTNGPQVAATAGALANALIQIAQAAAPIGGPVLKGVEGLANALADLADSNLGTPIMAAVAAMSLLNLGTKAYGGLIGTSFGAKAKASITGMASALTTVTTAQERATMSVAKTAEAEKARSAAIRGGLSTIGKGAAVAGALAIASSGLGDKMGYANTATLGLIGTMAGPYGAAAGAAVGVTLDIAKANNDFSDASERANQVLRDSPSAFAAQSQAIDDLLAKRDEFTHAVEGDGSFLDALTHSFNPEALQNTVSNVLGASEIDKQSQAYIKAMNDRAAAVTTFIHVAEQLGKTNTGFNAANASLAQLSGLADKIKPAMDALGISFKDLQNADPAAFRAYIREIENYNKTADSTKGRTAAFLSSLRGLNSQLLDTSGSASTLSDALNNLFGPKLNAEQAADALTASLKAMEATLQGNTKTFQGNTKAALENRAVTRQSFSDTLASLTAQAQAGAGAKQIASSLRDSRARFIQEGIAAGFSAKQMAARAKALGLTPKLIETVFKSVGLNIEQARLRDLMSDIKKLPKQVQTELKQNGYDLSKKQIADLRKQYDLTPKQVQTLLKASDKASALIKAAQDKADHLGNTKPEVKVTANTNAAIADMNTVAAHAHALDGTHADIYINTYHRDLSVRGTPSSSGGRSQTDQAQGSVLDFFSRGGLRESHVAQIAPANTVRVWAEPETKGEAYIPLAADWRRPRAQDIWRETGKRIGMAWMEYARGGLVSETASRTGGGGTRVNFPTEFRLVGARLNIDTGRLEGTMRVIAEQVVADEKSFAGSMAGRRA